MKWISIWLVLGLASMGLAACAKASPEGQFENSETPAPENETPLEGTLPTPRQSLTPLPSSQPAEGKRSETQPVIPNTSVEASNPLVKQAKADLAIRLGIDVNKIEIVSVDQVTWPDGGLGCPQPGMYYTQVMVEGYQIILRYQGRQYDYRTDASHVFLCENQ